MELGLLYHFTHLVFVTHSGQGFLLTSFLWGCNSWICHHESELPKQTI